MDVYDEVDRRELDGGKTWKKCSISKFNLIYLLQFGFKPRITHLLYLINIQFRFSQLTPNLPQQGTKEGKN